MRTVSAWSPDQMKKAINEAWNALRTVAEREAFDTFHKAHEASVDVEREHRRFMHGKGRYKLSVEDCARLFVLQHTAETAPVPLTWNMFVGYRRDVAYCKALRETLDARGAFRRAFPSGAVLTIDYANDVAA